jgi:hypothetical protein
MHGYQFKNALVPKPERLGSTMLLASPFVKGGLRGIFSKPSAIGV